MACNVAFLIAPVRHASRKAVHRWLVGPAGHMSVFPEAPEGAFLRLTAEYGRK